MEIPSTAVAAGRADVRICVAVCTCDRHEQLRGTLQSLVNQSIGARFCVFVVDNGRVAARPVVEAFENVLDIVHERVREPGLSAVRNRALHLARESGADFLASIDDDECADKDWLAAHLAAAELSGADIQIGPIEPRFVERPAGWIVAGGFFAEACETPTTANLFLRLACLPQSEGDWFQPDYAVTGGEDHEFLGRLSSNGARYGVVSSARVYDIVPAERATLRYILRRGLRDGVYFGNRARKENATLAGAVAAGLHEFLAKLAYAVNHLFWSPRAGWRARRAGVDLAAAVGILVGLSGMKPRFYGHGETVD